MFVISGEIPADAYISRGLNFQKRRTEHMIGIEGVSESVLNVGEMHHC